MTKIAQINASNQKGKREHKIPMDFEYVLQLCNVTANVARLSKMKSTDSIKSLNGGLRLQKRGTFSE